MIKTLFIRNISEDEGEAIEWLQHHYKLGRAGAACRKAVRDVKRLEEENRRLARKYAEMQIKYNKLMAAIDCLNKVAEDNDT